MYFLSKLVNYTEHLNVSTANSKTATIEYIVAVLLLDSVNKFQPPKYRIL